MRAVLLGQSLKFYVMLEGSRLSIVKFMIWLKNASENKKIKNLNLIIIRVRALTHSFIDSTLGLLCTSDISDLPRIPLRKYFLLEKIDHRSLSVIQTNFFDVKASSDKVRSILFQSLS